MRMLKYFNAFITYYSITKWFKVLHIFSLSIGSVSYGFAVCVFKNVGIFCVTRIKLNKKNVVFLTLDLNDISESFVSVFILNLLMTRNRKYL